jgi:predicted NBD/HSP70 family sugar kinase/biotin operon repressor
MNHAAEYQKNTIPDRDDAHKGRLEGRGADHGTVRMINRQLILNYLREYGPTPRVAIAKGLSLSRATVSSIIDELKKDGLVLEGKKIQATEKGGRRATRVHFKADAGYIIGIDLGRTRLRIYLTDLEAKILDQWSDRFDMKIGWKDGLPFIAKRVDEIVKKNSKTWEKVRGIGLSIPGSPDPTFRQLISPPLLSNWSKVDIPAYLREKLPLREDAPIYLDNDANMGALGESRYGAGDGIANMIYIKLSTGIGAGLILNGQLYRGSNGVAGEFGHVIIEKDSPPCSSCGKRGCLEALAGMGAIVEDALQKTSLLGSRPVEGKEITSDLMADVIIAAQEGDPASRRALIHAGERIGKAIGSYLINVYNPSVVLLDGGIIRPTKEDTVYENELLLAYIREKAEASSLPAAWSGTKIGPGKLGDDAVGLGAVATVIDHDTRLNATDEGVSSLVRVG